MKRILVLVTFLGLLCLTLAAQQKASGKRGADEAAIRDTEVQWSKAAQENDVERFASFYADDASLFEPNSPVVTGKEAIREAVKKLFATPGLALSFQTAKVDVARSGDMAYTQGSYTMKMNDARGKPMTDTGKYVTVYKKVDGKWKAVADIFNSDLPAPGSH